MGVNSFTPAKNRFRAHADSHYYLATEVAHPDQNVAPDHRRYRGYRGPTLRYCERPAGISAAEHNGDASGTATSSAFRDIEVPAGYVLYNVGDSIYFNDIRGLDQAPMDQLRLRTRPSCHDFAWNGAGDLEVVLGFLSGEIMSYLPLRKEQPTTQFSRGLFESTSAVTDVRWAPGRPGCFVAAHSHGTLLVYDTARPHGAAGGSGEATPVGGGASGTGSGASGAASEDGSVPTGMPKRSLRRGSSGERTRLTLFRGGGGAATDDKGRQQMAGPVACWHICQSAITQLAFSHDGRHLAMVCADGLLRVFDFGSEQLLVSFRSYYAGLLCVAWSPDDSHLLTGGEDDLVAVWSMRERRLVARCQGHSSWVTSVAFDPYAPGSGGKERVGLWSTKAANGNAASDRVAPPAVALPPGRRRLCFASVGMDTKLLLWEVEVPEADLDRGGMVLGAGSQVAVSHARGAKPAERHAANGTTTPRQGGRPLVAASRIARLPGAVSPKGSAERQFSVQASAVTIPAHSPAAGGAGDGSGASRASPAGPASDARAIANTVVPAPPLSAVPLLSPIGGVVAHAEPVTQVVFTPSAILTAGFDGHVRLWVPRVPPGIASSADMFSSSLALTFNFVDVRTTQQDTISASSKPYYIDSALNSREARPSY